MSWRWLWREWRSGELRLLFAALLIAVAAVSAVSFFTERIRLALAHEAGQLMGGDLIVVADHTLSAEWLAAAGSAGLQQAETQAFPSMVFAAGKAQLAEIKAVSPTYPLRGSLTVSEGRGMPGRSVSDGPARGTVWVDERLATLLALTVGEQLTLGRQSFTVSAILLQEPDRGVNVFALAPRLMMPMTDLPATGLIQPGSRVSYRLLLAGEARPLADFRQWLKKRLARGERLEDPRNGRPEIRNALDKAERFLGLATLLTVVISAVAVALASRRYMQRHLDTCAILRCLGLSHAGVLRLHLAMFVWLGLLAALAGCLLGFCIHFVLANWLASLLGIVLPLPGWQTAGLGILVALVLLLGFALPPLLQLSKVPTLRVLRRELGPAENSVWLAYLLGLVLLAGLIILVAGDWRLGMMAVAGFVVALLLFWIFAWLALRFVTHWPAGGFGWRQGIANLRRHGASSRLQIVALAIGMMAILLLTATRGQLLDTWQKALPADAPNRFVINIQEGQRTALLEALAGIGVHPEFAPMVRGRLLEIAGRPVNADSFPEDDRAQRLIEREFNLSWRSTLPPGNQIVSGAWFAPSAHGQGEASVEAGLAKTLGIALGDELVFSVAGEAIHVRVSSLRKLDWDSMRVNFFVLTPPGVIEQAPASYISSFYLPAAAAGQLNRLLGDFPNLTVIDISAVLQQFQGVIEQLARLVQFIFLFTLLAGGVVLYAALQSAFDERRYELSVMRALGAQRWQLQQALLGELLLVGALAGLIAGLGANLLGQLLASRVFQMDMPWLFWLLPLAALFGAVLSAGVGWWAVRSLLNTPPLAVLRSGS